MKEEISICDFPEDKIYVLLDKTYRMELIEFCINKIGLKNYFELSIWINKKFKTRFNGGDVKYWIEGERLDKRTGKIHPKFMPLWLVLNLVKLYNKGINQLDAKVVSYRSGGKGLIIKGPVLPIKITPELDSIVMHLFGDGAAGDFTPSYTQKNKESLDNFIKKLENCFGGFERSIYFTQGKYQIKFPKAMTDVLSKYYSIKSYRSYESEIPKHILERAKEFKLACLLAFIVDEGNIRDVISLYSVNKNLIHGIRKLCLDCNYNCSEIKLNKKARCYLFTISNSNIQKLYEDILKLNEEFPTCNLSFKENDLRFILNRRKLRNPKDKALTQKIILNLIEEGPLSARQISKRMNYAYCTIIHNLEELYENNKVSRVKGFNKTYSWKLN